VESDVDVPTIFIEVLALVFGADEPQAELQRRASIPIQTLTFIKSNFPHSTYLCAVYCSYNESAINGY
jgi:hypothetical protein